jgi:hypothetical protein
VAHSRIPQERFAVFGQDHTVYPKFSFG